MLGHGGGGRRTRSCFGIPRASLGIWKMMPRIREVLRGKELAKRRGGSEGAKKRVDGSRHTKRSFLGLEYFAN